MAEGKKQKPTPSSTSTTVTEQETRPQAQSSPAVVLKLTKPEDANKEVKWCDGTVDNEHLNRKKSKCCCVYKKPHVFGESDSSSDDDDDGECTDHCRGHKQKDFRKGPSDEHGHDDEGKQPLTPSS